MFKLIFGLLVVGCIVVIVKEIRKKSKEEEANEELHEELDKVKTDLRKVNVEEDVVDAKIKLKGRREEVEKKASVLDDNGTDPEEK